MISYDELQVCMVKAEKHFSQLVGEKLAEVSNIPNEYLQQTALSKRQEVLLRLGKYFEEDSYVSLWAKSDMFLEGIHAWSERKSYQYKNIDYKKPTPEEQGAINELVLQHQEALKALEPKKKGFWDGHGIAASLNDLGAYLETEKLIEEHEKEMNAMPQQRDMKKLSTVWDNIFKEVMDFALQHKADLLQAMDKLVQQKRYEDLNLNNAYIGLTGNMGALDDTPTANSIPKAIQKYRENTTNLHGREDAPTEPSMAHEMFHHINIPQRLKEGNQRGEENLPSSLVIKDKKHP